MCVTLKRVECGYRQGGQFIFHQCDFIVQQIGLVRVYLPYKTSRMQLVKASKCFEFKSHALLVHWHQLRSVAMLRVHKLGCSCVLARNCPPHCTFVSIVMIP